MPFSSSYEVAEKTTAELKWDNPSPNQSSPSNAQVSVSKQTGDNDWWLPRWPQPQPQPSPSQPPRLTDRDFLLRWEPSRHSPAIKGPPSVTEADLQQELIHTVSYVCFPSLPPPRTYINSLQTLYKWETLPFYPYKTLVWISSIHAQT